MANDSRGLTVAEQKKQEAQVLNQQIMQLGSSLESRKEQIADLLGDKVKPERFIQICKTAILKNPGLARCDTKSFFEAALACASDGLVPDGKRAAFVPYGSTVQYLPMVKGIVECLHRTGFVKDIQVDVVYKGERFVNVQGNHSILEHEPSMDRDSSKANDKNITGAYAIITTINGGVFKRAIGRSYIDKVKNSSRASGKGPWQDWFAQMCEKTALRALSKNLPFDLDLEVLRRDDTLIDLTPSAPVTKTVQLTHNPADEIEEAETVTEVVEVSKAQKSKDAPEIGSNEVPEHVSEVIEAEVVDQETGEVIEADESLYAKMVEAFINGLNAAEGWGGVQIFFTKFTTKFKDTFEEAQSDEVAHAEIWTSLRDNKFFKDADQGNALRARVIRELK